MKEIGDKTLTGTVGDAVAIQLNNLLSRVTSLESWKYNEIEPWKAVVNQDIEQVKEENQQTMSKMEFISNQIQEMKNTTWWIYVRDVLIITTVLLIIIFIIINSV